MRRLVIAAALGAAVVATAIPSSAPAGPTSPVGVTESTDGGVFVGVTIDGRPGVGASVAGGKACVGISLQVPQCATAPPMSDNIPRTVTAGPAYATVDTSNGVAVATGLSG